MGAHKMIKMQHKMFLSLIYSLLIWNVAVGSSTAADRFFDQKDESFWVIKKGAFAEAARALIDDEGNWVGQPPIPQYIKYCHELAEEDIPVLDRWLSLKELTCFAITDQKEQPNLKLIHSLYRKLSDRGDSLQESNYRKLAWLDFSETLTQLERGEASILPPEWVETNRAFQAKNSHYVQLVAFYR